MIALANLFRSVNRACFSFSSVLINLLIFPTYTLTTGNPITSKMVFTTLSLIAFSRVLAFFYIVEAVLGIRELKVALRRMQVCAHNCNCFNYEVHIRIICVFLCGDYNFPLFS